MLSARKWRDGEIMRWGVGAAELGLVAYAKREIVEGKEK